MAKTLITEPSSKSRFLKLLINILSICKNIRICYFFLAVFKFEFCRSFSILATVLVNVLLLLIDTMTMVIIMKENI